MISYNQQLSPGLTLGTSQFCPPQYISSSNYNTRVIQSRSIQPSYDSRQSSLSNQYMSQRRTANRSRSTMATREMYNQTMCSKAINLSAQWAMHHPEILPNCFQATRLSHNNCKIKIILSKTHTIRVRKNRNSSNIQHSPSLTFRKTTPKRSSSLKIQSKSPTPSTPSKSLDLPMQSTSSATSIDIPIGPSIVNSPIESFSKPSAKFMLKNEDAVKFDNYQNIVGELKDAISKMSGDGTTERYIKPSDIAKDLGKKIPPVIPAPPPLYNLNPIKSSLRHVTPPTSPIIGRVVNKDPKTYANGITYANDITYENYQDNSLYSDIQSSPTSEIYQNLNKFNTETKSVKYTNQIDPESYEAELLRYLPQNIDLKNNQSSYLAPDGTEWEVFVIKPEENILSTLQKVFPNGDNEVNQTNVNDIVRLVNE